MDCPTKILLVEDNVVDADSIQTMLHSGSDHEYSIECAASLSEAIGKLQNDSYDVVLMDLFLPDASGTETLTAIQNKDADVPIVVISSMGNEKLILEAIDMGIQGYLVKDRYGSAELNRTLCSAIHNKEQSNRIFLTAHNDSLTGLTNRAEFYNCLEQAVEKSSHTSSTAILMMVDLDHFKQINEQLGHVLGDQLLREVAQRLSVCLSDEDLIARLGGDDFAVILNQASEIESATRIAENIVASLSRSFHIGEQKVNLTCSLGVAFYPLCKGISDLMYCAEVALFRAKRSGGNRYKIYTDEISREAVWKYGLQNELGAAIEGDQFIIHYQPLQDLHSGNTAGVEALLRWQHPEAGLLLPGAFIEQLETSKIGWDLSEWIIMLACRQLKSWHSVGNPDLKMDINLSPFQLCDPDLLERVVRVLKSTGLEATHIEFELTERQVVPQGDASSLHNIRGLREMGVTLALDDYGTGNSSDSYLRDFPRDTFSTIKIDRSYIKNIITNPTCASCVKRDIDFAHELGMRVIAEGIENIEQMECVRAMGADIAQGFLISKAMAAPLVADGIYQGRFNLSKIYHDHRLKFAI